MNMPKLIIYHPNGRGTGSALRLELHPATDNLDGYIDMTIAPQATFCSVADHIRSAFDWDANSVFKIKLTFDMVCWMLQVLRGECESIKDGDGVFIKGNNTETVFKFRHCLEPCSGYIITIDEDIYRDDDTSWRRNIAFTMTPSESLGLSCAIEQSLGVLCFGVPCVV